MELEYEIRSINEEFDLEIDLSATEEIYGDNMTALMDQMLPDVLSNIRCLIDLGLQDMVSDVCNRYGPILLEDPDSFRQKVRELLASLGDDPLETMGEDLSVWEALM